MRVITSNISCIANRTEIEVSNFTNKITVKSANSCNVRLFDGHVTTYYDNVDKLVVTKQTITIHNKITDEMRTFSTSYFYNLVMFEVG